MLRFLNIPIPSAHVGEVALLYQQNIDIFIFRWPCMKRGKRKGVDSGIAAGAGVHPATQTMRGGRRSTLQWPVAGARVSAAGICADPSPTSAACMNRGQSDRHGEVARTAEVARAATFTTRGGHGALPLRSDLEAHVEQP
jgi:hypothetical protein